MEKEENILGKEPIGKLLRKFSISCIISLLFNFLYNIVVQIFIGWGVGYLGNGATNVSKENIEIVTNYVRKKSCVIVGRYADYILKDEKNVLKIFIYSDMENKIKRATEIYGLKDEVAEKEIRRINKLRANHYKYYTENKWSNKENYDICINSDKLGVEKTAKIICNMI